MPWFRRVRLKAGHPLLLSILSVGVAVSCVSITRSAELQGTNGLASAMGTAAPALLATPAPTSMPDLLAAVDPLAVAGSPRIAAPTASPSIAATPAVTPSLPASPTAQPSPAAVVADAPAVSTTAETLAGSGTVEPSPTTPSGAGLSLDAGPSLDEAAQRKLANTLRTLTGKKRVAGLQVAVRLADGQTWLGSAGNAQFGPDRPIRDDTVFAVASITKTFIAALILQLAEEGRLDLDEPFGRYFRDAPRKDSVTIRQLLSHSSGIYDYFANPRYQRISRAWLRPVSGPGLLSREHRWTYEEIMDLVKTGYCKPGECYRYSNTNYVILGRIAEAAGGAPLHAQLRARFFDPLGMTDTVYQPAEQPPADAAHGHWDYGTGYSDHTRDARVVPFMAAVSVADAAGAIASTARDLSIWAGALYGGGILSDGSLAQMTTFLPAGTYGLGTDVAVFAGHRAHGHRGGLRGFDSSMWYFPADGVSIVLLSSQGNWMTDRPMEKLVRVVLGRG